MLDAVVARPRLYAVPPEQTRGLLEDQRLQPGLCVRLAYVFAASALAALVGALCFGNAWAILRPALLAVQGGRPTRPEVKVGICGRVDDHPASIRLCHQVV